MSLIETKNLYKTYFSGPTEIPALRSIDLKIEKGEFAAIMGPSGSGKSTLLHILGLLDSPTKGDYIFEGKSIKNYSSEELARIRNKKMGFVFQQFNLLPRTSVLENIKLPLIYSSIDESLWEDIVLNAAKQVKLEHRLYHEPSQLSGGEQQRAAIARALVTDPDVIFADEPTGNLDSKSGKIIMEILQGLNEEGHTIVLITHETFTAEHAQRIIRVMDGEIESDKKVAQRLTKDHFIK